MTRCGQSARLFPLFSHVAVPLFFRVVVFAAGGPRVRVPYLSAVSSSYSCASNVCSRFGLLLHARDWRPRGFRGSFWSRLAPFRCLWPSCLLTATCPSATCGSVRAVPALPLPVLPLFSSALTVSGTAVSERSFPSALVPPRVAVLAFSCSHSARRRAALAFRLFCRAVQGDGDGVPCCWFVWLR